MIKLHYTHWTHVKGTQKRKQCREHKEAITDMKSMVTQYNGNNKLTLTKSSLPPKWSQFRKSTHEPVTDLKEQISELNIWINDFYDMHQIDDTMKKLGTIYIT